MELILLSLINKKRRAMTLFEMIVAVSILAIVGTIVVRWFYLNSQYQKRVNMQFDNDSLIRTALWEMHKNLRAARTILYPRVTNIDSDNNENNIISDSKLIYRNFKGDIFYYYYDKEAKEIIRDSVPIIPYPDSPPEYKRKVIAKNIDKVIFTNKVLSNNLVGIYIEAGTAVQIDSVYLMND